jgi:ATP synthase protein I
MTRGAEIAGTVLVVVLLGFVLDRWLGTTPWLMLSLVVLAVVAQFVKLYYVYNAQMTDLEAQRREAARAR